MSIYDGSLLGVAERVNLGAHRTRAAEPREVPPGYHG